MFGLPPIVLAALTGLIAGLLLSFPVGPINLTILNEGARKGFKWAALIGLGATVMELIYCFIAFTGLASFFAKGVVKSLMEWFSFTFMLFLGAKFLFADAIRARFHRRAPKAVKKVWRLEERVHPSSAFMIGFVRVMGNVGVLAFWVILAANFISREWVTPDWPGKLACVGGVTVGAGSWYLGLAWGVSLGHGKLSQKTLRRMERYSGLGLIILALIQGGNLLWHIYRKH